MTGQVLVANANIKLRSGATPGIRALAGPSPDFITLNEVEDVPLAQMRSAAPGYDAYREELLGLIDRKAAGEEIVARPAAEETGKVLDLMAALEASLARAGAAEGDAGTEAKATRTTAKRSAAKKAPAGATAKAAPRKAATPAKSTKAAAKKAAPAKKATRARKSA